MTDDRRLGLPPGRGVALYYVDDFSTAPEPATLALVALGGIGLLAGRRR